MKLKTLAFAAALAALLSGTAMAQMRDLTVEQNTVAQATFPNAGALAVALVPDRADATYALGETVRLTLTASEDAYVTVLDIAPSGAVTQLFPNRFQVDNKVYAGRPVEIAGPGSGGKIAASGTPGTELIKVIASSKPIVLLDDKQLQARGIFYSVDGGVPTLTRDLTVVANAPAQADNKIATGNFAIYTVAGRASATTILPVVGAGGGGLINIPADQPFPLLLASDKRAYRVGEKVTLALTTLQACTLTVLDVTPAGRISTIFPNATTPNNKVEANQTVLVAGGSSAIALPVSGPAGLEQVVAICSTDANAPAFNAAGDRTLVQRDLSVVAANAGKPGGATAMASITFAVAP